jgi:hypothetical protein
MSENRRQRLEQQQKKRRISPSLNDRLSDLSLSEGLYDLVKLQSVTNFD